MHAQRTPVKQDEVGKGTAGINTQPHHQTYL
jgi:hypothetical protein